MLIMQYKCKKDGRKAKHIKSRLQKSEQVKGRKSKMQIKYVKIKESEGTQVAENKRGRMLEIQNVKNIQWQNKTQIEEKKMCRMLERKKQTLKRQKKKRGCMLKKL